MAIYNYWCPNCTCGAKGSKRDFKVQKEEDEKDEIETCPNDESSEMKLMGEDMAGGYLATSAMSREDKAKMMKKRSSAHFKKEIAPRKEAMEKLQIHVGEVGHKRKTVI